MSAFSFFPAALLLLALALLLPSGAAQELASAPWPVFGGNAESTRASTRAGPAMASAVLWRYATGGAVDSSPAVAADGSVFVGSDDGILRALNGTTGALLWASSPASPAPIKSSPALGSNSLVYVGGLDGELRALNASTGAAAWSAPCGAPINSSPTLGGDLVYIATDALRLLAFAASTGVPAWNVSLAGNASAPPPGRDNSSSSSPVYSDGSVFVGSLGGDVFALDAANGAVRWRVATGAPVSATPALADGLVYVGNDNGTGVALDRSTGELRGSIRADGGAALSASPSVSEDSVVFAAVDGNIYVVDRHTGAVVNIGGPNGSYPLYSSPATDSEGNLYIGSTDAAAYGANMSCLLAAQKRPHDGGGGGDGSACIYFRFATGGAVISSPAIGYGRRLFFGSRDGWVYAISGSLEGSPSPTPLPSPVPSLSPQPADNRTGLAPAPWPVFGANTYSTRASTRAGPMMLAAGNNYTWRFRTGGAVDSSPAVSANFAVYIGSDDGRLYALNGSLGTLLWASTPASPPAPLKSSPALSSNGFVIVGSLDGSLLAFNATSGDPAWSAQCNASINSSPTVGGDLVFIATDALRLFAFAAATGAPVWNVSIAGDGPPPPPGRDTASSSSPVYYDDVVYVGSLGGDVFAIDAARGVVRWRVPTGAPVSATPALADGAVWLGNDNGTGMALDAETGGLRGSFNTDGGAALSASPSVAKDHVVFAALDGCLYFVDRETGVTTNIGGPNNSWPFYSSPATDSIGNVFIGDTDGGAYGANMSCLLAAQKRPHDGGGGGDGSACIYFRFATGGAVISSPAIGYGKRLFFGSRDGWVYAIGGSFEGSPSPTPLPSPAPTSTPQPADNRTGLAIAPWPVFGANTHSTRASTRTGPTLLAAPTSYLWRYYAGGAVDSSPAVAANFAVYVGSDSGVFSAINGSTGLLVWEYATPAPIKSSPALGSNSLVYFGNAAGTLYALNATSGTETWSAPCGAPITTSPTVGADLVFIATDALHLFAVDAATGAPAWNVTLFGYGPAPPPVRSNLSTSSPVYVDRVVYISSLGGDVLAFDALSGAMRWRFATGAPVSATPALADGIVYVGNDVGVGFALSADTGALRGSFNASNGSALFASPSIAMGGAFIVFANTRGDIYIIDSHTGAATTMNGLNGTWPQYSSPATDAMGNVYLGARDGAVYGANLSCMLAAQEEEPPKQGDGGSDGGGGANSSKCIYFRVETGAAIVSSPAIGYGRTIFIGSRSGYLYAIGPNNAPTPTLTRSATASSSPAASASPAGSSSPSPVATPLPASSSSATTSSTASPTASPLQESSVSAATTVTPSPSLSPSLSPADSVSASSSASPAASASPAETPSASASSSAQATASASPSVAATPSVSPSVSPTLTSSSSASPSLTASSSTSPSQTPSPTPSLSPLAQIIALGMAMSPSAPVAAFDTPQACPLGTALADQLALVVGVPASNVLITSVVTNNTVAFFNSSSPINCGVVNASTGGGRRRLLGAQPWAPRTDAVRWLILGSEERELRAVHARRFLVALNGDSSTIGMQVIVSAADAAAAAAALRSSNASVIVTANATESYAVLANVSAAAVASNVSFVADPVPVSSSRTPSTSITPSESASATASASITPTSSATASTTASVTLSPSVAATVSVSQSSTVSASVSSSPSASASLSASASESASPSASATPSSSMTASASVSASSSVSATPSSTPTVAASVSASPSVLATTTTTPSASASATVSPTGSASASTSPSASTSATATSSATSSVAASLSASASVAASATPSQSTAPTSSATESSSPSPPPSTSVTPTQAASASISPSPSVSPVAREPSASPTPSTLPPSWVVLRTSVSFALLAHTTSEDACNASVTQTVLDTVAGAASAATAINGSSVACTAAGVRRQLAHAQARRLATSAIYVVSLNLATAAAAQAAYTAVLALGTGSFRSTSAALAAVTHASAADFLAFAVGTTATCANGTSIGCTLPTPPAPADSSSAVNVGAIVGGVVGGLAAIAIVIIAVGVAEYGWFRKPRDDKVATAAPAATGGATTVAVHTHPAAGNTAAVRSEW